MLNAGVQASAAQFAVGPPSFGLGTTAEVSPVSMANAYSVFVTGGVVAPLRTVSALATDAAGTGESTPLPDEVAPVKRRRVLPQGVADGVAEAMSQVVERGTAPRAKQAFPVYAKTGTTNDAKDVWFIGCAKAPQNLCISVWMGYEYKECTGRISSTVNGRVVAQKTRVAGPCGGMHDLHGFRDVYGGTLPALVFARTFAILAEIQQARTVKPAVVPGNAVPRVTAGPAQPVRGTSPAPRVAPITSSRSARPSPSPAPNTDVPPPVLPVPSPAPTPTGQTQTRPSQPGSAQPSPTRSSGLAERPG